MDASLLTQADLALRPGRGVRNPWLREALAAEGDQPPAPPPRRNLDVDVAIVGGGYTGLWTAYHLTERAPELRIAILEQDICGGGPSGRNGGFVNGWWDELDGLAELHGEEQALAAAREVAASVYAIGAWCERHGVDAHFRRAGMLTVSTTPLHDGRMDGALATAARLGVPEAFVGLTQDEVRARCGSPRFRNGALMADAAIVHPALLVRGLRRVVLERGVAIHEETRVGNMTGERDPFVWLRAAGKTGTHEVRARHVVLAVNAWATAWRPFRNRLLAWGSYMVRSESIPERLRELGWTGGESITDARASVHYLQATRDGRIAIGAGGGRPGFDGRIGPVFTDDVSAARRAAFAFRWFFPQLADVRLTDAWGGPIDISPDHLPRFGTLPGGRVHYGFGYSGNGVAPSHLGGRILAALALEADEPVTRLGLVDPRPHRFPPEPLRYVGARVLREAMIRLEDQEEAGRRPPLWLRELTRIPRRLGYHLGPGG
jgi:glycine/D-amino acid oxidase-like deaminating enzyme